MIPHELTSKQDKSRIIKITMVLDATQVHPFSCWHRFKQFQTNETLCNQRKGEYWKQPSGTLSLTRRPARLSLILYYDQGSSGRRRPHCPGSLKPSSPPFKRRNFNQTKWLLEFPWLFWLKRDVTVLICNSTWGKLRKYFKFESAWMRSSILF